MPLRYITNAVGMLLSNSYILYDEDSREAIIIDAGDDAWKILESIQDNRLKIKGIYATHCHFDHVLAVDDLRDSLGCEFYIHPDDREILASLKEHTRMFLGIEVPDPPRADGYVNEGDEIRVGNYRVSVLHTPGHSPGSVCYHVGNLLFSGDTLFRASIGRTDGPGGDAKKIVESIHSKLFTLPDDTQVLPGHGPATSIGYEKEHNPFVGRNGLLPKT